MKTARAVARADSYGAALGSIAFTLFAIVVWLFVARFRLGVVLLAATVLWGVRALPAWGLRSRLTPLADIAAQVAPIRNLETFKDWPSIRS